jgi:bifunctional ADP-heptose synthase (sugar kinase/adenylyltransferase)
MYQKLKYVSVENVYAQENYVIFSSYDRGILSSTRASMISSFMKQGLEVILNFQHKALLVEKGSLVRPFNYEPFISN